MMRCNLIKFWTHRLFPFRLAPQTKILGTLGRSYGIDISHWEETFDPDLATPGLIDFAIFKATEGSTWKDASFESFYANSAGKVGVLGAYHYLRSGISAQAQAGNFLDSIQGKDFQILVCDFESTNNTMDDAFVQLAQSFGVIVQAARPEAKLLFYTNPSTYDNVVYPGTMRLYGQDVFTLSPWAGLWIAQYYYTPSPDKTPSIPNTRKDWLIWQYSEAGNPDDHGTGGWVDQNVWNGTPAEMYAFLGDTTPPPVDPPALDIQVTTIKPDEVESVGIIETGCMVMDDVSGNDVAFNLTGFDYFNDQCTPNMYRRINGKDFLVPNDWDPGVYWVDGFCYVERYDHITSSPYTPCAAGLKRFVILNGQKNPAASEDWNNPAIAWNIIADGSKGETYLFTVKETCTLNQAVDGILAMGLDIFNAGDLDSGHSTKVKYRDTIWQAAGDAVANFAVMNLKESGGTMKLVVTANDTLFYRVVSGIVKGDDGKLPAGFELPLSNETISQNGKDYTLFRNSLSYLAPYGAVKQDNVIESRFLELVDDTTPPPTGPQPPQNVQVTLPDNSTWEATEFTRIE